MGFRLSTIVKVGDLLLKCCSIVVLIVFRGWRGCRCRLTPTFDAMAGEMLLFLCPVIRWPYGLALAAADSGGGAGDDENWRAAGDEDERRRGERGERRGCNEEGGTKDRKRE
jgi:hypothetical protein